MKLLEDWYQSAGLQVPSAIVGEAGLFPLPLGPETGLQAPDWLRTLDSLYQAGLARLDPRRGLLLPADKFKLLEPYEKSTLQFPQDLEGARYLLRTRGVPGRPDFRFQLEITPDRAIGPLPDEARRGPFLSLEEKLWVLPPFLADLVTMLGDGMSVGTREGDLRRMAALKALALHADIEIDSFLRNETGVVPEGITIEAEYLSPTEVRLNPIPVGGEAFAEQIKEGKLGPTLTLPPDSRVRRRLLLGPEEMEVIQKTRDRVVRGSDVPRFMENPAAFLPDEIDLSRFSPRVKGLVPHRYHSQPALSIRKSGQRDWFETDLVARLMEDNDVLRFVKGASAVHEGMAITSERLTGAAPQAGSPTEGHLDADTFSDLSQTALATGDEYVLHQGNWIRIPLEEARNFLATYEELQAASGPDGRIDRKGLSMVLEVATNVEVLEYVDEPIAPLEPRFGDVARDLPAYPLPETFLGNLRPYQLEGYRWLRDLYERRAGALLADDMGLGKTVQVIALLAHLKSEEELRPTLIVVPLSLMTNWVEELRRFCPTIQRIHRHEGPGRARHAAHLAPYEVVLTTYETLRSDQIMMGTIDWALVICDEAQKIKNPGAKITSVAKAMKSRSRIAMTGTPIENTLSELWCIADFVQAGKLGTDHEFLEQYERTIIEAEQDSPARQEALRDIQNKLGANYLRRTKAMLAKELPPREYKTYPVGIGPRQGLLYDEVRNRARAGTMKPLPALQALIQICSHPELHQASGGPPRELIDECPKLSQTIELLEEIRQGGEKALIFTRYRTMQRILQDALQAYFGIFASIVNGENAGSERQRVIDRFQAGQGFSVLILSPEAAGVGLNITKANHVIHYSRLWNPAKEQQATDRVYRIGQDRKVFVHYPVVTGGGWLTVEEHLDNLLAEKRDLAEAVVVATPQTRLEKELSRWVSEDA